MKYFELKITLLLNVHIIYKEIHSFISSNINKAMTEDVTLKNLHINKKFKPYCIGSLYPFDLKNKIYKANQVYILTIRSIDKGFLNYLKSSLKNSNKLDFKVLAIEFLEHKYKFIESAYSLTPTVISISDENNRVRHWTKGDGSLEFVKRRIKDNLQKKYIEFYGENLSVEEDFISMIEIKNHKPIVFNYKRVKLYTNKFKIVFASDENSQKLAFLAFGVGILEKNSLGFGFLTRGK